MLVSVRQCPVKFALPEPLTPPYKKIIGSGRIAGLPLKPLEGAQAPSSPLSCAPAPPFSKS